MRYRKNDYFELIQKQVGFCVDASVLLKQIMLDYSSEKIEDKKEQMHNIEHQADELQHEILTKLTSEFITPIDQEDILRLVQIIDDVTDALDEVVLEFYMYRIEKMPSFAAEIVELVVNCVKALQSAANELKNYKRPEKLREYLVQINTFESQADEMFVKAIHDLFSEESSYKVLICNKAIYEGLEDCCDNCEHAADVINQIIIKNT